MVLKCLTECFNVWSVITNKNALDVNYLLKENCFEREVIKACKSCLEKKTQIENYLTEISKLERLPESEFGNICYLTMKGIWIEFWELFLLLSGVDGNSFIHRIRKKYHGITLFGT